MVDLVTDSSLQLSDFFSFKEIVGQDLRGVVGLETDSPSNIDDTTVAKFFKARKGD